jgi:hypothetical protein
MCCCACSLDFTAGTIDWNRRARFLLAISQLRLSNAGQVFIIYVSALQSNDLDACAEMNGN